MTHDTCPHCKKPVYQAVDAVVYYMHDNFTFLKLVGDVDSIAEQAQKLAKGSPSGMLTNVRLIDAADRTIRSVGESVHQHHGEVGLREHELNAWRGAVSADAEAVSLLTGESTAKHINDRAVTDRKNYGHIRGPGIYADVHRSPYESRLAMFITGESFEAQDVRLIRDGLTAWLLSMSTVHSK